MDITPLALDLAFRGAIVAGVAFAAALALRSVHRPAALTTGLLLLALLPLSPLLPHVEISAPWVPETPAALANREAGSFPWVPFLWLTGTFLCVSALLPGWLQLRTWYRAGRRATDERTLTLAREAATALGLRKPPVIRLLPWAAMPAASGWGRGTVFLPEEAMDWPDERLGIVLRHELAHLRRRDPAVQTLVWIACAVHWFNPLVWLLRRQWLKHREFACDRLVLATGVAPRGYATHLVDVATSYRQYGADFTAAMAASGLETRVRAILHGRPKPGGRAALGIALLFLAGVGIAAATLSPAVPRKNTAPPLRDATQRWEADPFPAEAQPH